MIAEELAECIRTMPGRYHFFCISEDQWSFIDLPTVMHSPDAFAEKVFKTGRHSRVRIPNNIEFPLDGIKSDSFDYKRFGKHLKFSPDLVFKVSKTLEPCKTIWDHLLEESNV